jgi:hypothetical protein
MTKGAWEERSNSDQKRVVDQMALSVLSVCAAPATVKLYAFGVFLCGELSLAEPDQPTNSSLTVRGAILSEDFSTVVVFTEKPVASSEDEEDGFVSTCTFRVYDTSYLKENKVEIAYVAKICAQVSERHTSCFKAQSFTISFPPMIRIHDSERRDIYFDSNIYFFVQMEL